MIHVLAEMVRYTNESNRNGTVSRAEITVRSMYERVISDYICAGHFCLWVVT
jgi:hypothetical protein